MTDSINISKVQFCDKCRSTHIFEIYKTKIGEIKLCDECLNELIGPVTFASLLSDGKQLEDHLNEQISLIDLERILLA